MSKYLQKIKAAEEEIAGEILDERIAEFEGRRKEEAFEFRGSLRTINAAARTFSSAYITGLMEVEEKKYWHAWGYGSFLEFLDSDEVPEFGHNKFYDLKKVLMAEGPDRFDLLNGQKIPLRIRKLLAANQATIEFDGDMVRIGDFEAPAHDRTAIVQICEAYNGAFQILRDQNAAKDKKIENQDATIQKGSQENEHLRRQIDHITETPRYNRALMGVVSAFFNFIEAVGELDDSERPSKAADLETIVGLYYKLSDAYGVHKPLADTRERDQRIAAMKPVEEMTDEERRATFLDRASALSDDIDLD
ncbi:MAG: hypothetical protein IT173_12060 [Acidobacteria bacterium]|nr:hypothetical protein [Acidobacteriota bacterium]